MAGFAGLTHPDAEFAESTAARMREMMHHAPTYVPGPVSYRSGVAISGIEHFPPNWRETHIHETDALRVWVHGEVFSVAGDELTSGRPAERIAQLYSERDLGDFAGELNGTFCAFIHDLREGQIHLFNDRYGFKAVAWGLLDQQLVFGTEVKVFLEHSGFEPTISEKAVANFIEYGHLLDNTTWFDGVEMLGPAGILTYDTDSGRARSRRYWHWDDVPACFQGAPRAELEDEMARLMSLSVERRSRDLDTVGCFLSGGLDSRAVFSAIPEDIDDVWAATFGHEDSEEVRIAREVAETRGAEHLLYSLTRENWFRLRAPGVWWTDGHFPIMHMHGIGGQPGFREHFAVNLHGFLGGGIQGRRYEDDGEFTMFEKIENRGRRFINEGVRCAETFVHNRRPFIDYDFVDFALGMPDRYQRSERLYQDALLKHFPQYFAEIPWEKTGLPVSASRLKIRAKAVADEVRWFLDNLRHGFRKSWGPTFADYVNWLVQPPYRDRIESILLGKQRIWPEFLPDEPVRDTWERLDRGDRTPDWERMGRVLSMEIWLQQALNGRLRPDEDIELQAVLEGLA
ncbi:MAG: asparagine synthase-related protein [Myxococcota bacterium]